jgi:hypothetical protein
MSDTIISVLMLTGVVLTGGAAYVFRQGDKRRDQHQQRAALVMFANVAVWLVPGPKTAVVESGE